MLTDIKIAKVATYDPQGVHIAKLKKINFIYGSNGCGKTTASNFLSETKDPLYGGCSVTWEYGVESQLLVYNKKFRDNNFGTGEIAGVFTLGQATKEQLELIQTRRTDVNDLTKVIHTSKETFEKQENVLNKKNQEYIEECWKVYKKYEGDFKDVLRGSIGSKKLFSDQIIKVNNESTTNKHSYDELIKKSKILLGEKPSRISNLDTPEYGEINKIESSSIWEKSVVGKDGVQISGLIEKLKNHDWVNHGRNFIENSATCPFCQNETITASFKEQLEEYFDESFSSDIDLIKKLTLNYEGKYNQLVGMVKSIYDESKIIPDSIVNSDFFLVHLDALKSVFESNLLIMKSKGEKASHPVQIHNSEEHFNEISKIIEVENTRINTHNEIVLNYQNELNIFKKQVWEFLAVNIPEKYSKHSREINGLERGLAEIIRKNNEIEDQLKEIKKEIVTLSKNITSVQPAVDEMNKLLLAYGFYSFVIVPSPTKENHYCIQRASGELAHNTLSEGEVTFITFLYYLQLVKGATDQSSVTNNRILVIDDPISSLDSNILYVVSSIVKGLVREVKSNNSNLKQLILLTHNVYFHKEVSFINGRVKNDKDTHFWILRKVGNLTSIQGYEQKNPIESSYELLWREVKDWQRSSGITVQNIMRRIVENYFSILGCSRDDKILEKFESHEEKQICKSLLHWINDGSHCLPDDLFIQSQDESIEKYLEVFRKIFKYTNNEGHYNMMMGIENAEVNEESQLEGNAA